MACILFYIVGKSVLRHMDIIVSSVRTEECLNFFDSFHHVLFLYVPKTFLTQYPKHNPNVPVPVLWPLKDTFKVFAFWSVLFLVAYFWWLLSAFITATVLKVCYCSCYKPFCCHFIDFEWMAHENEGAARCCQKKQNAINSYCSDDRRELPLIISPPSP